MLQKVKKQVTILATSISMIDKKTKEELEKVSSIWYFVTFKDKIKAILNSRSKFNAMSQAFAY